jgi:endonuclease/exonuclease/phosphatase family metal-dependent hydrolase
MNFRIASFNVENLILPGLHYYERFDITPEAYAVKANWIASILDRARADIIGLQEVWLDEAIQDAVSRSTFLAKGTVVVAPGTSRAENVQGRVAKRPRVGLISRYPVKSVLSIPAFPATMNLTIPLRAEAGKVVAVPIGIGHFQRAVLKAVIDVGGTDIVVFVAHLKSKGPMIADGEDGRDPFLASLGQARATMVRAAEAAALRHLILEEVRDTRTPVIVLGDLNDTPESASTQIVCGPAVHAEMNHAELVPVWDVALYSSHKIAFERAPNGHTHVFAGERDILDHILLSNEFYPRNRARIGDVISHEVLNQH